MVFSCCTLDLLMLWMTRRELDLWSGSGDGLGKYSFYLMGRLGGKYDEVGRV